MRVAARGSRGPPGRRGRSTCITPRARAASVPGRSARCWSDFSAVRERIGVDGHEARAAPARLLDERPEVDVGADDVGAPGHDEARVHDGLGVEADATCRAWPSGRRRRRWRRWCGRAGSRPARGRSAGPCCRRRAGPCCPRTSRAGSPAAPCSAITPRKRSAMVSSASSHEMRSKRPSPFVPDAPQRMQDAVGAVDAVEVLVHLRAEEALGERGGRGRRRCATARPSSTSTVMTQVSGQSCGQTTLSVCIAI